MLITEQICGKCGARPSCAYCERVDALSEAFRTRVEIMQGKGGRNAQARLAAANAILAGEDKKYLTDDDLLAEVQRRVLEHRLNAEKKA